MKVSKRSWHYRLYRYIDNITRSPAYVLPWTKGRTDPELPASLCPYAWSIFLGVVGAAIVAVFLAVVLPIIYTVYGTWIAVHAVGDWLDRVAFRWIIRRIKGTNRPASTPPSRTEKEKHPSLVVAFAKAKKEKVCPMIELVD